MARHIDRNCLECPKLSIEQARQIHGLLGDNCWDDARCHKRRSHYRNRGDRNAKRVITRQLQQQSTAPQIAQLSINTPDVKSAVLIIYSECPDNFRDGIPIHSLAAEVWVGNQPTVAIEPIHCFGMRGDKVTSLLPQILEAFSAHVDNGKRFKSFAVVVHRHTQDCPLRPCPFHPQ